MVVDEMLGAHSSCEREFIAWLNENPGEIPPSSVMSAPVEDVAMWGVSDDEWHRSVLTARLMRKCEQASRFCPVFSVVSVSIETEGMRTQIWAGSTIFPGVLEEKVGYQLSQHDEQLLSEILSMLPPGWSIVIEGRGQRIGV